MPPIPLEPFRLCVFARHRPAEIGYTCISLFFGNLLPLLSYISSHSFRLDRLRRHHLLRFQNWLKRKRSVYLKTGHH